MTLTVGNMATTVEVTDAAATLDTTTAQLQTTIETNQIQNLPSGGLSKVVNGAGIWNLSLLGAGVASSGGVGQGAGPAIALTKRFSHNVSFIAAYTWSHMEDNATATNFSTYLSPRRAQDFRDLRSEWATSALDRRHRFAFTSVYDFRIFRDSNWFLKNVVSNWNMSGTYTYESPEQATVQSGVDSNLNGDSAGDRAVITPNGIGSMGSDVTGYNAAGRAVKSGDPTIVAYVANDPCSLCCRGCRRFPERRS